MLPKRSHYAYTSRLGSSPFYNQTKMKIRITFLIQLFFISYASFAQSYSELYKECSPRVVVIETEHKIEDEFGQASCDGGLGTGVLLDETGNNLTAAHVMHKALKDTYAIRFFDFE